MKEQSGQKLLAVNKKSGQLVQADPEGTPGLEDEIKEFLKKRDSKPGNVFLGVIHRIDRPVSGVVLFAKSSKALARLNEMLKNREFRKIYWALTEKRAPQLEDTLVNHIVRDGKTNKSKCVSKPNKDSKETKHRPESIGGMKIFHVFFCSVSSPAIVQQDILMTGFTPPTDCSKPVHGKGYKRKSCYI